VRINEFTKSNELLEKQIELDIQKNKEEKLNAEKENELQMKSIETKYNDAIRKVDGLAEKVKSAQQSNADLESKMRQLYKNHSDELNNIKSRQEEDLACLKAKLGSLEAENKELVDRNEQMAVNEKRIKLIVKELENKVNEFSTHNKKLTVDLGAMKDKQEECLKELDEMQAEKNKIKKEVEVLKEAAKTNEEKLNRLQHEKISFSEEVNSLEENLVEVKTSLRNEEVLIDNHKQQLGDLVFIQKRSDEDLMRFKANIKETNEAMKQTELQIKKVNEKLESQGIEILTRNEENEKTRKKSDRLQEEKKRMIEELLQVRQQLTKVKRAGFFRRLFKKY